jgi:parallel beta-helix repeat protein
MLPTQSSQPLDTKLADRQSTNGMSSSSLSNTRMAALNAALPVSSSSAPSYFVATNGSDQNAGTIDKPLHTLQAAIAKIGDGKGGNIFLRGGTYNLADTAWIGENHDGSASSHLVIRSYQSEKAILDGQKRDIVGVSVGGQYVDIAGLEIRNTKMGVIGWGAYHLGVLNNIIHDTNDTGIASYAPKIFGAADVRVDGNTVYHTNQKNSYRGDSGNWGSGITMSRTDGAVVTNNQVYENYGEGITATLSNNVRIANNVTHDNYSVELYMDNATNSVFENNFVYNSGNTNFFRKSFGIPQPASGIRMANEAYADGSNPSDHNIVRNNIVVGTLAGFEYANYGKGGGMKNSQIVNNTFYGGAEAMLRIASSNHQNTTIANNIFHQTKGRPMTVLSANSGVSFDHNLWFGGAAGLAASATDVKADSGLVSPGGFQAVNYKLRSGSAAIDAGGFRSDVTQDFFGERRPVNRMDIGADEFN